MENISLDVEKIKELIRDSYKLRGIEVKSIKINTASNIEVELFQI